MADSINYKGTVLLTGGSGFLGSHTADALSSNGYKVKVFDRVESPFLRPDQEMIVGDITDPEALDVAARGCDYLYHIAGMADIEEAKANPLESCNINIQGTLHALEAARKNNIKRFVFSSTVYVYSNSGAFYRVSKQACENYIETYGEVYGLPYTILRYGSLYGRRAGVTNGIYKLIKGAIDNNKIVYNGDSDAMREYIHINDAAQLSVDVLADKFENQRVILTGAERIKLTDLMRMISEILPNNPKLEFGNKTLAAHYVMTPYKYNPKIAHKLTGESYIDLGQGILDCVSYIHENADNNKPLGTRKQAGK